MIAKSRAATIVAQTRAGRLILIKTAALIATQRARRHPAVVLGPWTDSLWFPALLGCIHGLVRNIQKLLDRAAIRRELTAPDADANVQGVAVNLERL